MCSIRDVNYWKEFFDLYRHYPELWKIKCEAYKNRILKRRAYAHLLEKYREYEPDATEDILKKKINNIRGCYRREVKKVEKSIESGCPPEEVYKPNLWYYENLSFLKDQEENETDENITSLEIEANFVDSDTQENCEYQDDPVGITDTKIQTPKIKPYARPTFVPNKRDSTHASNKYESRFLSTSSYESPRESESKFVRHNSHEHNPASKRLATEKALHDLKIICKSLNQPPEEQNEFDCFGVSVACQLKKLPEKLAQESMDYIQSFLVKQRLNSIENPSLELSAYSNNKRKRHEYSMDHQENTLITDISHMAKLKKEKELEFMQKEHNERLHIFNLEKRKLEKKLKYDEEEHMLKVHQLSTMYNQSP